MVVDQLNVPFILCNEVKVKLYFFNNLIVKVGHLGDDFLGFQLKVEVDLFLFKLSRFH